MTPDQRRAYDNARYQVRREEILNLLGGVCIDCCTDDDLQIDHVDASAKTFDISRRWTAPWEVLLVELAKCVLRCGGCHRKKTQRRAEHAGGRNKIALPQHGTHVMYSRERCRCGACKAWKRRYRNGEVDAHGVQVLVVTRLPSKQ